MTFTPKDHARLFDDLGRTKVARRIVNREFKGETLERARDWLAQENAKRARIATFAGVLVSIAGIATSIAVAILKAHGGG